MKDFTKGKLAEIGVMRRDRDTNGWVVDYKTLEKITAKACQIEPVSMEETEAVILALVSVNEFIQHLIKLQESRTGKPNNRHKLRFLLQWIHEECKLRWPNVSKREIWDIVKKIDGYDFERGKE